MLRGLIGNRIERILGFLGAGLDRKGITPNQLTFSGFIVNLAGAFFYFRGFIVFGGFIILFGGLFDMLDGAVARSAEKASKTGAFLDSVVDRYSDFVIFGGILLFYAAGGDLNGTIISLFIISGSFLVSYTRARAELVIPKCDVGLMERPERIILLSAGSILGFFYLALWLLAVLTHLTAIYRILHTLRTSKDLKKNNTDRLKTP